jgi:hypothetical protein
MASLGDLKGPDGMLGGSSIMFFHPISMPQLGALVLVAVCRRNCVQLSCS